MHYRIASEELRNFSEKIESLFRKIENMADETDLGAILGEILELKSEMRTVSIKLEVQEEEELEYVTELLEFYNNGNSSRRTMPKMFAIKGEAI